MNRKGKVFISFYTFSRKKSSIFPNSANRTLKKFTLTYLTFGSLNKVFKWFFMKIYTPIPPENVLFSFLFFN